MLIEMSYELNSRIKFYRGSLCGFFFQRWGRSGMNFGIRTVYCSDSGRIY